MGWKRWARQFNAYLDGIELYFSPDLIILGGGVSKEWPKWGRYLKTEAPLVTATYLNTSGIIGAAYAAAANRPARRSRRAPAPRTTRTTSAS
jgi:polyphosphate glucokinase